MKKFITAAVAAIGIMLAGCSAAVGGSGAEYKQISQTEAMEMMNTETNALIVDVRTPSEYADGHIPDAINVPNESIDESVETSLPDKDQTLLIYCRSGNRSKQASQKLADLGYTNVYEFGGINTWSGEIEK